MARRAFHTTFLVAVGIAGWLVVIFFARAAKLPPEGELQVALLFLGLIAGARALSFPLAAAANAEVSLDAAIFVAGACCFGPGLTALAVAVVLAGDGLRRGRFPYALYLGGVAGGLLALWSRAFGIDRGAHDVWLAAALGGTFLISHYGLQALQQALAGSPVALAVRRNGVSALAEASLLPLAAAIVLIFDPQHPVPFALLGGTYLLVNYGFKRLADLAAALRRRVAELETLNRTAHALGATLETPALLAALLRETARALPRADRIDAIVDSDGALGRFRFEHGELGRAPVDDEARAALQFAVPRLEPSRMIVPLTMYGETTGALVAESHAPDAFGPHELRLLDAIGGQAAAAVENARLYALANVDGLTGLYVRRYFDLRVSEEIERARRFGTSFALVMLDLDNFKRLNDTHGHIVGDRALRGVAQVATGQLRGVDLAARYGGEELAFLLPRTSLADAHAVAERIRAAIAAHDFVDLRITASLGVAGWAESGVVDPERLVERADAALYRAKAAGKNRVEIDLVSFELTPSLAPVTRRVVD
jgi:diguanylate cyclase (GGDEF)-like protein